MLKSAREIEGCVMKIFESPKEPIKHNICCVLCMVNPACDGLVFQRVLYLVFSIQIV